MSFFEDITQRMRDRFGESIKDAVTDKGDPWIVVEADKLREVMEYLRDDEKLVHLSLITGVDYVKEERLEVVYHLDAIDGGEILTVKVLTNRNDCKVPSVADIYRTADWHEREVYDLSGVTFEGHPNLTRILCADDWVGHPLRKDYAWPEQYHGIPCGPYAGDGVNMPPEWDLDGFQTIKSK